MYNITFRKAALSLYEYFRSMRKVASILHMSIASLSRWSHRLEPRGYEHYPSKATNALIEVIRIFMQSHPVALCPEVVSHVRETMGISISRQLVHQILKTRLGMSFKRTRKRGRSKLRDRFDFQAFFAAFNEAYSKNSIVAIDESGFDQRAIPLYAYAPRGVPAIVEWTTCTDHQRYNLLMSIHQSGLSNRLVYSKPTNGNVFADFLETLPYRRGTTLLLDNASIHKTRRVHEVASRLGYALLFTPPYCPEYNPIELVFGIVKKHFYASRYSAQNYRLLASIDASIDAKATVKNVQGCFRHVCSIISSGLNAYKEGGKPNRDI